MPNHHLDAWGHRPFDPLFAAHCVCINVCVCACVHVSVCVYLCVCAFILNLLFPFLQPIVLLIILYSNQNPHEAT